MNIQADVWLGRVLGSDAFKVVVPVDGAAIPCALAEMASAAVASKRTFFFAKIPTTRVDAVRAFTSAGFYVVDTGVTFEREPPETDAVGTITDTSIRLAEPTDEEAVLQIAGTAFVYSRFHLDPQIPAGVAHAVKRAWVESYFRGKRGEQLLVAVRGSEPVGFLAGLKTNDRGKTVRVIDLIGVSKSHQGHGIGRALTGCFIAHSVGKCGVLRVGTQAANIPSLNLYFRTGFHITESVYILHAHGREGQLIR
jgi:ribosomal protein S18 acetylase RimI-like enzyme